MKPTTSNKPTRHTCGGPKFGRLTEGCPACHEIWMGYRAPVRGWTSKKEMERVQVEAIKAHDCKKSNCGPVCTFGDW